MSSSEAAQPDSGVVPQDASETKDVGPVKPSHTLALSRLPNGVKITISKADEILLRLSKLIKTTAGLGAALSTLNYSIYLAAYLHAQSPTRAAVVSYISRLIGRAPSKLPAGALTPAAPASFLTTLGSLVSDTRTTLRLTGLLPLYIWYKTLLSKKASKDMDPTLHRVALLQCSAYIAFQALENIYHLGGKGVLPMSIIEKRGGIAKWVAWSCRAWLVGVASDFLRLWREAEIEKTKTKTAKEKEDYDRKWWNEFMVAAYWMPVAIHYSLYPDGVKGMNTGLVGFFGLMAGLNNFRSQWASTA
ncbi:uncharacterized protein Z518_03025 [Rhinocladiella mackenziei CBS 650.93]|uniref:Uncharacterized protein n=1 Tax=Rhinocladiella mackenziei CBS 650.93 TaxID=1442369 RepID=A0A0D2IQW7_9EURO|nr:uncharacterized protein Z518_03025 [Rhinocladiella mackenziei CBS 650.93]KIX08369.1 hypothetical protein Z518_03025 [Rhinocladiella mackenziei CBS 650.93]